MNLPAINGNWVDFIILLILLFFFVEGLMDRFLPALFSLIGFILTYAVALTYYGIAAGLLTANFNLPHGIANALGFFIIAILTEAAYNIIFSLLYTKIPQQIKAAKFNKYLGFLPALGNGFILVAFVLTLIITLPTAPNVKKAILDSRIGSALVLHTQAVEQTINGVFGQAVDETLTFLTVKPQGDETIDLKFTTNEVSIDSASEEKMLALVNEERKKQGLKPVVADEELRELSRAYAKDMFERGFFSHYNPEGQSPFDRMEKAGITYKAAGENLAYAPNVDVAHTGLMNSPGHRANILSKDFGHVGIGVIDGGIYGKMFVQEFTN